MDPLLRLSDDELYQRSLMIGENSLMISEISLLVGENSLLRGAFWEKDIWSAPLLNFLCRAPLFPVVSVLPPLTGKEKLNNNTTKVRNKICASED